MKPALLTALPLTPPAVTPIGNSPYSWASDGETISYYCFLEPFDFHDADDTKAMYLRIAKFRRQLNLRTVDLATAFAVSKQTIARILRCWDAQGAAGFNPTPRRKPPGRPRSVVTAARARQATDLLAAGCSQRSCAQQLGIAVSTLNYNLRRGVIQSPQAPQPTPSEPTSRAQADRQTTMCRA